MSLDEMCDDRLHDEFSAPGTHVVTAVATEPELSGFQRYRTAALVGAGGLACAAAGALLGGLGGYFSISPATSHATASPTITQDLPLAQAVNEAPHSSLSGAEGSSAVAAAEFSKVFGSLTKGSAPFASFTSEPFGNLPVSGLPGLGDLGSLTGGGNPSTSLSGLVPTLEGIVTYVTGALLNLSALLPIASLPLPTGGLPLSSLAGAGGSPLGGLPVSTGGTSSNPVVGALDTVTAAASGAGTSVPSLPVPTTIPSPPSSSSSTTTTSTTSSGSSSTTDVPLPVPVTTPTVTIGGLSVGVNRSGSTSGLTLTLP